MRRHRWPTAAELHELLEYDPETGLFRWRDSPALGRKAGRQVGTVAPSGYVKIKVLGVTRQAHRIAWTMHYGRQPTFYVDHINRVRSDNRIANLRDVPPAANSKNNPSTPMLVGAVPGPNGTWRAAVHRYGMADDLGEFPDTDAANQAWETAKAKVKNPNKPRPQVRLLVRPVRRTGEG